MRVTLRVSWVLLAEWVLEYPGQVLEVSEGLPTTKVSRQRVSSWIHAAMVAGKKMLPKSQSIEGL